MKVVPSKLNKPSPLVRAATYLLVPVVLLLALPILLLFVLVLYFVALFHGGRFFIYTFTGKTESPEAQTQKPHFLAMQHASDRQPDSGSII